MNHSTSDHRSELVDAYRCLKDEGLSYGSAGNLSVRVGDLVLITPSGIAPESLTPDQICAVNLDGIVREAPQGCAPSSEVPLHLAIYRATSARAVVHAHSPRAVSAGLGAEEIPIIHYVMRRLGGSIPVVPYRLFGSDALAALVAEAVTSRASALMRNHGAVTTGASLGDAVENYRTLEWVCGVYLSALAAGRMSTLEPRELELVAAAAETKGYRL